MRLFLLYLILVLIAALRRSVKKILFNFKLLHNTRGDRGRLAQILLYSNANRIE